MDNCGKSTEILYNCMRQRLKFFIVRRINDPMTAEDILHDVFIKVHDNIKALKNPAKIESWIFQIARNAVIDYQRKRKPVSGTEDDYIADSEEYEEDIHKKAGSGLAEFVENLPPIYRDAIVMTEYEGLTQKQMAERLNISLTGAKSRVQRAKKMLKDSLLKCCHYEYDRYGTIIDYYENCCCCHPGKK